jgi:hypothetical protein
MIHLAILDKYPMMLAKKCFIMLLKKYRIAIIKVNLILLYYVNFLHDCVHESIDFCVMFMAKVHRLILNIKYMQLNFMDLVVLAH